MKNLTLSQFYDTILQPQRYAGQKFALLVGNGLGKSHPDERIRKFFEFSPLEILEPLKQHDFIQYHHTHAVKCPEDAMRLFRALFGLTVFDHYLKKWAQIDYIGHFDPLAKFLLNFNSVYSINYDSIIYNILVQATNNSTEVARHDDSKICVDGFSGRSLRYCCIQERQNNYRKIYKKFNQDAILLYFLHGNFHISEKDGIYTKTEGLNEKLIKEAENKIVETIKHITSHGFTGDFWDPLVVFDTNWRYKKAFIDSDKYLSHCYQSLTEELNVLVFGCSLAKDDHLIEALFKTRKDHSSSYKNIYVTCLNSKEKMNLYIKFSDILDRLKKNDITTAITLDDIFFVDASVREDTHRILWQYPQAPRFFFNRDTKISGEIEIKSSEWLSRR